MNGSVYGTTRNAREATPLPKSFVVNIALRMTTLSLTLYGSSPSKNEYEITQSRAE